MPKVGTPNPDVGHPAHPGLINTRFAYVSISRASQEARIYTNDASTLGERLSTDIGKTSAVALAGRTPVEETLVKPEEPSVTNIREQSPEEQGREVLRQPAGSTTEKNPTETGKQHYAPVQSILRNEASGYEWKHESNDIQSYQHRETAGWLHIDARGQFYDRQAKPITREDALAYARDPHGREGSNQWKEVPNEGQMFSL